MSTPLKVAHNIHTENEMKNNIQIITINSDLASQILIRVSHEAQKKLQRKLSAEHINYYASEMERGSFGNNTIHLMNCQETGLEYLVNGQHTLHAIVKSNASVYLTFWEQDISTYKEVINAYTNWDRGRLRSFKDAINIIESDLTKRDVEKVATALKYVSAGFGRKLKQTTRVNDNALLECVELYKEDFKKFKIATMEGDLTNRLYSKSTLSIILLTIRYHPAKALSFWKDVAHGDKLSNNSPAFRLRKEILEHSLYGGSTRYKEGARQIHANSLAELCILCWNAYFNNKSAKRLPYNILNKNLDIAGVPIQEVYNELNEILRLTVKNEITFTKTDFSKIKSNNNFSYNYEGINLERVTSFVKKLCPPFDRDGIAQQVAAKTNRPLREILSDWDFKGKMGRELGEKVHTYIEERLNGIAVDSLRIGLNGSAPKEFDAFDKFYSQAMTQGLKIEKSEWIVGDKDYKIGGRIDALFNHPKDGYVLVDFKTGKIEEWNRDKFHPPFDDIPSDSLYQYSFQLSMYKIIIERNTNIEVGKMYIIHLRPDGSYEVIPAEDYGYRLKQYLSK